MDKLLDRMYQGGEETGLDNKRDHSRFPGTAVELGDGSAAGGITHYETPLTDETEGGFEGQKVRGDKGGKFTEGVAEEEVGVLGGMEGEMGAENGEDADGGEEDCGLGVFGFS